MREQANTIFGWAEAQKQYNVGWLEHSRGVAYVAETIAKRSGLDTELAYACGLLHDLGKYAGDKSLRHPIVGYEMLMERGMEMPARIAMTHTYYGYPELDRSEFWAELSAEDINIMQDFLENAKIDDYDKLIQLADFMYSASGVMTINDRFVDVMVRHPVRNFRNHLKVLYALKKYFDERCGQNVYDLFKNDIIKGSILGPKADGWHWVAETD